MKGKLILLLVLILLFGAFIFVKFYLIGNQNQQGQLRIISSPGTSVFIDNVAIGQTPYDDKYKVGEYLLKLIPEGTATDTASWQGKIRIYKNSETFVNRELGSSDITSSGEIFTIVKMEKPAKNNQYGEIYVESEPVGAIVYLDNDEKGVGPMLLADVLKGEHEISVLLPGFFRRTQKINVEASYRLNAVFKLAIDGSQTTQPKTNTDNKTATPSADIAAGKTTVTIKDTPTGWLRVRDDATLDASESGRVNPGDTFELLEEKTGWYKILFDGKNTGWISAQYSEKK